jgi:hypothetical protein
MTTKHLLRDRMDAHRAQSMSLRKPATAARLSQPDPLHLRLRDLLFPPVVKPGRARTRVRGHVLGVFERAAILQKIRNPRRAEGVVADRRSDAGRGGAPADHEPCR